VLTPIDPMIIKAINQDEFRDFSFVNPDWKPHLYRIGVDSTETTVINSSSQQSGNLSNNIQNSNPITTSSSENVQVILVRSNSQQNANDLNISSSTLTGTSTSIPSSSDSSFHAQPDSVDPSQKPANLITNSSPSQSISNVFNSNTQGNTNDDNSYKILERNIMNTDI
jgi:hypothetical protein